ncbi:MAG: hypothetical protein L0H42_09250 [Yaniella sp.]|uniref:hypothetical protein n=1 Tax=Yaniella sp. TaxID=2773929 RepID=UPI002648E381|nr:hypothetical protein [Yaniella sp.]MDN5818495.1 hypothetical protein [Yaniella sp.]
MAPPGTKVKAKVLAAAAVSGVFAAGISVSPGIEVELGDGLQPQAEINIELPIDERHGDGLTPVFAVQVHDGKTMAADFDISESGSRGVIRAMQLSVFGFVQIGMKDLRQGVLNAIKEFFNLSVRKPECYREEFELFGTELSLETEGDKTAWLCFSEGHRPQANMKLDLNTPGVWLFGADVPQVENVPTTVDLPSTVIFSLFRNHPGIDPNTALAMPKVTSKVTFSDVPSTVEINMSTGYTVTWSVLSVAASLIPLRNLQELEHAQCIADLADGVDDPLQTVKGITGCIAEVAGNAGLIFGLLSSAPASLAADISGVIREATGTTSFAYTLERRTHNGATNGPSSDAEAGTTRIRTYTPLDASGRMRQDVRIDDRTDLPPLAVDSQPSPSATRTGTYWLGATVDSASACWENPDAQEVVVCLENPWSNETFTRSIEGRLPASPAASNPALWALELSDGSRWQLRTGGSWAGRPDGWYGAYRCIENCHPIDGTEQVILANDEYPDGYDDSLKIWTAFVGEISSDDPAEPEEVSITEGWFVG